MPADHALLTLLTALALASCAAATPPVTSPAPTCPSTHLDAGQLFSSERVEGTFVLRDEATGCTRTTNSDLAETAFRPQSTFKIANALIGLETGVIKGPRHVWTWDGTTYALAAWQQDLDLAGALRVSCVPCFQDVSRRVGAERMRRYLQAFGYGNEAISGPIDQFWLGGPLRITPRGQTEFVHRMLADELAVKPANVALIWRLLELERGPDFTLHGKTGLGFLDGRAIGWLVGYVQRGGRRWIYATFVRSCAGADVKAEATRLTPLRERITRALLTKAGVLRAE